ncbi:VOC family protein [Tateyamaria armeniaca]|uniref:VOC family protein n=1 Tax=Tateyamaria armeniaca TaxID=2518930 RepID=A0ABW8UZF2_9RHOB
MRITKLDHVNLRTAQLDRMIAWYVDILGLENGARPDFGFPGAWLYAGDAAIVHLIEVSGDPGAGSDGDLKLEHFALRATDVDAFEARLNAHGVPYKTSGIAELGIVAFNIWDPDGNHIHVDFTESR